MLTNGRKWLGACRSFYGHICTVSPKGLPYLDLGLAELLFADGSKREAPETLACAEGIATVQAKYPWVDTVDLQLFPNGL